MHGIISVEIASTETVFFLRWHLLRLWRWRIITHSVDEPDGFQNYVAADRQAFDTQLVHRVLHRVVKAVVVPIVNVDDIQHRHAGAGKWNMVIFHSSCGCEKVRLITKPGGRLQQKIFEPRS